MAKRSLLTDRWRFRSVVGRGADGLPRRRCDDQFRVRPKVRPMWNLVSRVALSALFATVFLTMLAHIARAEPLSLAPRYVVGPVAPPEPRAPAPAPTRVAAARGNMGGGFLEAVFGGGGGDAPY